MGFWSPPARVVTGVTAPTRIWGGSLFCVRPCTPLRSSPFSLPRPAPPLTLSARPASYSRGPPRGRRHFSRWAEHRRTSSSFREFAGAEGALEGRLTQWQSGYPTTTTTTSAPHFLKPHLCGGRQATQRVACLAFSGSSVLAPPFFFFLFLRPARLYRGRACSVPLCHVARGSRLTIRCRRRRQRASASESPGGGSPAHGAERTPRAHARARAYSGRPGPRRRERSRRLPLT